MEKDGISRGLLSLVLVTFFFVVGYQIYDPILTLYMREVGATELEVGLMLAFSILVQIVARIPFAMISDKLGRKVLIICALVIQFLSIIFLYFTPTPSWFSCIQT